MRKIKMFLGIVSVSSLGLLAACGETDVPNDPDNTNTTEEELSYDETPTIFLAGDSTVKTYEENQFIGGWGQYLDKFLDDSITVKNCAQGGRSSRSFINEGRLYDRKNSTYTFKENGGNSIGDEIKAGDFLFIQFGHNDDSTKAGNTLAERMVPLGEKDANGIYPTTPATETTIVKDNSGVPTNDSVSQAVKTGMSSYSSVLTAYLRDAVSKYGDSYYEYGNGTYKWYLKQYIDFARSHGATPVLVTPVSRVKFANNVIIGGAGLHGENFAYVEAVKQLAEEENCMCIDLFSKSKTLLETATPTYSDLVMALKPNSLVGTWPEDYDYLYKNTAEGYEGIEATHYNKYGAFIEAAYVAEAIKTATKTGEYNKNKEYYNFKNKVHTSPEVYIEPSNLMPKEKVAKIEETLSTVNVKNPNRSYYDPALVVTAINNLTQANDINNENYLAVEVEAKKVRKQYFKVNIDDRGKITNINSLVAIEQKVEELIIANRPVPTETIIFNASDLTLANKETITSTITSGDFKIVGASGKAITVMDQNVNFKYNGTDYSATKSLSMGGSATFGSNRYIEFETTKDATITVVAKSSGTDDRIVKMVKASDSSEAAKFDAKSSVSVTSASNIAKGKYQVGSAGSGMYIFAIIIEYFD
ncbi:MAG: hypothetical protein K6F81_01010 [Acholeplasmatales bacterium]|nr:hypothetical protein [Acholeplasmatales bacterium]